MPSVFSWVLEVFVGHIDEESEATLVGAHREVDDVASIVNAVEVWHELGVISDDDLALVLDVDEVFI